MQITTIHKLQHALDTVVKILKFVWRHALTLTFFGIMVYAVIVIGRISWINCFYLYSGSIFFDWFKMKWKISNGYNNHSNSPITSFAQANYWNSSIVGTPAYLSEIGHRY